MIEPQEPDTSDRDEQPGKTAHYVAPAAGANANSRVIDAFTVFDEVLVGKMPLRVDILLIRREDGQLSETGRRELSALIPLLSRFTLLEFKGPTDSLGRGDFAHLVGCAFLWHGQQSEPVNYKDVSLIVLAPTITGPFHEESHDLGCEARKKSPAFSALSGFPL